MRDGDVHASAGLRVGMYHQGCTRARNVFMAYVEPNGRYHIRGGPEWREQFRACMREQFSKTPYVEWVGNRPTSDHGPDRIVRVSRLLSEKPR